MNYDNFETQAIRTQTERSQYREHSTPLFVTSSFVFEDAEQACALFADEITGNIYTPTRRSLQKKTVVWRSLKISSRCMQI